MSTFYFLVNNTTKEYLVLGKAVYTGEIEVPYFWKYQDGRLPNHELVEYLLGCVGDSITIETDSRDMDFCDTYKEVNYLREAQEGK